MAYTHCSYNPKKTWFRVQIMKLDLTNVSPPCSCFLSLSLRNKYSPQKPTVYILSGKSDEVVQAQKYISYAHIQICNYCVTL